MADTPKKTGAETGAYTINGIAPTAADIKLVYALISSFNSKPDVNWEKVAAATGNSAKSSQERWRIMQKKFNITFGSDDAGYGTPGTAGTPARKGKKVTLPPVTPGNPSSDHEGATVPETPRKKFRKTPFKGKGKAAAAAEEDTPLKRGADEMAVDTDDEPEEKSAKKKKAKQAADIMTDSESVPMDIGSSSE